MKVRWNQNSLRLRITPSELADLERGDPAREEIRFPGSTIVGWSVVIQPGSLGTSLLQRGCSVLLLLSDIDRKRLSAPDAEGIYFSVDLADVAGPGIGNKGTFRYFIEKDFPCIHPRTADALEDPTETFAAPPHFADKK
jgi:hypothetical protein